jgi:hypothetical protein
MKRQDNRLSKALGSDEKADENEARSLSCLKQPYSVVFHEILTN